MTSTRRLLAATLTGALMSTGLLAAASTSAHADPQPKGHTHLNSVGERNVGERIPIVGWLVGTSEQHDKTLVLQRKKDGSWHNAGRLFRRGNGRFMFSARRVVQPQTAKFRVMVKSQGRVLHYSERLKVVVIPEPVVVPVA